MLSLLPVLVHDPELPLDIRAALHIVQIAPNGLAKEMAKRRAAATFAGRFGLTAQEIADLVGLPDGLVEAAAARTARPVAV